MLTSFFSEIRSIDPELTLSILEVGARPLSANPERFYHLLKLLPGTQIYAIEVDKILCDNLNSVAPEGLQYFPEPLGDGIVNTRVLYDTMHPMCSSLYKPNESFLGKYKNLEVMALKKELVVDTISLDEFVQRHQILALDFVKIDIQGAELDVFRGGLSTLTKVLAIVTEVEFVPLYENQPLYGDVAQFLLDKGFMHHKFTDIGSRSLKSFSTKETYAGSQQMWADALFLRDIEKIDKLTDRQLLKLGVIALIYGSPDFTSYCFKLYDERCDTALTEELAQWFSSIEREN